MSLPPHDTTMYVFYKLTPVYRDVDIVTWSYDFPSSGSHPTKRWTWVDSGRIPKTARRKSVYEYEEMFVGNMDTRTITKKYLETVFKELKACGVVDKYKIRMSYAP